ncbi:MAG: FliM/FliN family flagellar motor C-terminal domain-containing protein [Rhodocyclaceae bacterium]
MHTRPLRGLSSPQKKALQEKFSAAMQAWSHDWLGVSGKVSVGLCAQPDLVVLESWTTESEHWQWFALEEGDLCSIWLAAPLDAEHRFAVACGLKATHPLAGDAAIGDVLATSCWADLKNQLALAAGSQPHPALAQNPLSQVAAPFSGAAMLRVTCEGFTVVLVLDGEKVAALVPAGVAPEFAPTELHHVPEAVDALAVSVECELRPMSVPLGTLASLAVGDVLVCEHGLHEPLYVRTRGGDPLCRAYLGKHADTLALAVVPETN